MKKLFGLGAKEEERSMEAIKALSNEAFELARARWKKGASLEDTELERARAIQDELLARGRRLRDTRPRVFQQVSHLVSEGLLDCTYAIEAPDAVSLRLNQHIEEMTARAATAGRAEEEE